MIDLSHYKFTDDWSWYDRYAELMGEEQLKKIYQESLSPA